MKDIEAKTVTISAGFEKGAEDDIAYWPDLFFEYLGYAPNDWLEFGIAGHYLFHVPMVEAKVDLAELLLKAEKFSLMPTIGIGPVSDEDFPAQAGLIANYRLGEKWQVYTGAGTDLLSEALNLQVGAYWTPKPWFGLTANAKLVAGDKGTSGMISVSPVFLVHTDRDKDKK